MAIFSLPIKAPGDMVENALTGSPIRRPDTVLIKLEMLFGVPKKRFQVPFKQHHFERLPMRSEHFLKGCQCPLNTAEMVFKCFLEDFP